MARFIKRVIIFLAVSCVLLAGIVIISSYDNIDKHTSSNTNIISLQINSDFDSLDILFVGNSYCYSGIRPVMMDSIGLKSYNLGIATAGVEFYDLIIDDYLENVTQYPESIFLLISPMTFSSRSDNFPSYPIHRYLESPLSNFKLAFKYNRFGDLLPLYKKSLKKTLANFIKIDNKNTSKVDDLTKSKGYVGSNVIVSRKIVDDDKYLYQPLLNDGFNEEIVISLNELLQSIKDKGIEIVFFELPANLLNTYFNKQYLLKYEQTLNDLTGSYTLLRIDQNLLSESNYRNTDHLNNSGSIIATNELIRMIRNNDRKPDLILNK